MPRSNGKSFLVAAKCILERASAFPLTVASSCMALSVEFRGSLVRTISPGVGTRRLCKPWPSPLYSFASVKIPSISVSSSVLPKFRLGHFPRGELIEPPQDS